MDWSHQERAVDAVLELWARDVRRVCLVAPTGAGKTEMGGQVVARCLSRELRGVWLTHTQDLVRQSARRLERMGHSVGILMADEPVSPFAPVQVASVQTLIAREHLPPCDFLVIDEAHHWAADEFRLVAERLEPRFSVGLTATPQRGDGRPLGDLFEEIVVACHYSELVGKGVLVPVRVLRPREEVKGVAEDPVKAYLERGEKRSGFVYVKDVPEALRVAMKFCEAGVPADVVHAKTPKFDRELSITKLRDGRVRLLVNVYALTEGVDVPNASLAILCRGISHVSMYLQIAGRILRACEGKEDALLLDLPGVSHRFGAPIEDRDYSLDGEGIKKKGVGLCICLHCGFTFEGGGTCPRCGQQNPKQDRASVGTKIVRRELEEKRFDAAPDWQKKAEFQRLQVIARNQGYKPGWAVTQFVTRFGHAPAWPLDVPREERKATWDRLKATKGGQAAWIYFNMFKQRVPREWR